MLFTSTWLELDYSRHLIKWLKLLLHVPAHVSVRCLLRRHCRLFVLLEIHERAIQQIEKETNWNLEKRTIACDGQTLWSESLPLMRLKGLLVHIIFGFRCSMGLTFLWLYGLYWAFVLQTNMRNTPSPSPICTQNK